MPKNTKNKGVKGRNKSKPHAGSHSDAADVTASFAFTVSCLQKLCREKFPKIVVLKKTQVTRWPFVKDYGDAIREIGTILKDKKPDTIREILAATILNGKNLFDYCCSQLAFPVMLHLSINYGIFLDVTKATIASLDQAFATVQARESKMPDKFRRSYNKVKAYLQTKLESKRQHPPLSAAEQALFKTVTQVIECYRCDIFDSLRSALELDPNDDQEVDMTHHPCLAEGKQYACFVFSFPAGVTTRVEAIKAIFTEAVNQLSGIWCAEVIEDRHCLACTVPKNITDILAFFSQTSAELKQLSDQVIEDVFADVAREFAANT